MKGVEIKKKYLPCDTVGGSNEIGKPFVIMTDEPVYSAYTSKKVWIGPIPFGIDGDAPIGHKNYGKKFHHVTKNAKNESVVHRLQVIKK
jgi:hypothetical protein